MERNSAMPAGRNRRHSGSGKGKSGRVGYSEKIHDPAFQKYLKNTNRWSSIFAGGLAVIAVVGFHSR